MAATRLPQACLEEAVSLARAIHLHVCHARVQPVARPNAATLLGGGQIDNAAALIKQHGVELMIMDTILTPVQQRNLEARLHVKVLDRTGLILEIFGARAATREGRLQVELANLTYQRSRLVRSWTHLERQRGGLGFVGGPGETQIEADRRMLQARISQIKKRLESVVRTRTLHRRARAQAPWPIVALIGYTNAGKSTLFNRLTQSDVIARDMLFATLDPAMRAIKLPCGQKIMLSDTVGFISDLPTMLVAAFRATLEEVLAADVIVHVRDSAHADTDAQQIDVMHVVDELGVDPYVPVIEVLNKSDLMDEGQMRSAQNRVQRTDTHCVLSVLTSALSGQGLDRLTEALSDLFAARASRFQLDLTPAQAVSALAASALAYVHNHGQLLEQETRDDGCQRFKVLLTPPARGRFEKKYPGLLKPDFRDLRSV